MILSIFETFLGTKNSDIYVSYAFFLKRTFGPTFLGDDRYWLTLQHKIMHNARVCLPAQNGGTFQKATKYLQNAVSNRFYHKTLETGPYFFPGSEISEIRHKSDKKSA